MQIQDGQTSNVAGVDDSGRLKTRAVSEVVSSYENENNGKAFSLLIDVTTSGSSNHFAYIKNTSDDDLHIDAIAGFSSTTTEISILGKVTGTATSASGVTPANRNLGSGLIATGTFQQGADLLLTGGSQLDRWQMFPTDNTKRRYGSNIIIPKNQTLVLVSQTTATINATISMYYHG